MLTQKVQRMKRSFFMHWRETSVLYRLPRRVKVISKLMKQSILLYIGMMYVILLVHILFSPVLSPFWLHDGEVVRPWKIGWHWSILLQCDHSIECSLAAFPHYIFREVGEGAERDWENVVRKGEQGTRDRAAPPKGKARQPPKKNLTIYPQTMMCKCKLKMPCSHRCNTFFK